MPFVSYSCISLAAGTLTWIWWSSKTCLVCEMSLPVTASTILRGILIITEKQFPMRYLIRTPDTLLSSWPLKVFQQCSMVSGPAVGQNYSPWLLNDFARPSGPENISIQRIIPIVSEWRFCRQKVSIRTVGSKLRHFFLLEKRLQNGRFFSKIPTRCTFMPHHNPSVKCFERNITDNLCLR